MKVLSDLLQIKSKVLAIVGLASVHAKLKLAANPESCSDGEVAIFQIIVEGFELHGCFQLVNEALEREQRQIQLDSSREKSYVFDKLWQQLLCKRTDTSWMFSLVLPEEKRIRVGYSPLRKNGYKLDILQEVSLLSLQRKNPPSQTFCRQLVQWNQIPGRFAQFVKKVHNLYAPRTDTLPSRRS